MKKRPKAKGMISIPLILLIMILVVSGFVALTYFEMDRYEDGLLDVCATQQDSYVQLVIDQINLKENRTDEEIIENILSTLDSSSNRYWTFSKDQTVLYVKDALETNRYQALTADSYYKTDTSAEFIGVLALNVVKHRRIFLDNKEYIASGALFEYGGNQYRICLLTNTTVLLDNNKFLGSKMELIIIFFVAYSIIFIFPIIMAMINNRAAKKVGSATTDLKEANNIIEHLNELLVTQEIYDNRKNLFNLSVLKMFVEEYRENRKAFPLSFMIFKYGEKETVANFFGKNCVLFGKRDIKFYDGKRHLAVILSVKCNNSTAKDIAKRVVADCELLGVETAINKYTLEKTLEKVNKAMGNPDIESPAANKVLRPDSRTESRYRS